MKKFILILSGVILLWMTGCAGTSSSAVGERKTAGEREFKPVHIQDYSVRRGDTFSRITRRYWKKLSLWPALYILNSRRYPDPDRLYVRNKVKIYKPVHNRRFLEGAYRRTYEIYSELQRKARKTGRARSMENLLRDGEALFPGFKERVKRERKKR